MSDSPIAPPSPTARVAGAPASAPTLVWLIFEPLDATVEPPEGEQQRWNRTPFYARVPSGTIRFYPGETVQMHLDAARVLLPHKAYLLDHLTGRKTEHTAGNRHWRLATPAEVVAHLQRLSDLHADLAHTALARAEEQKVVAALYEAAAKEAAKQPDPLALAALEQHEAAQAAQAAAAAAKAAAETAEREAATQRDGASSEVDASAAAPYTPLPAMFSMDPLES